MTDYTVQDIVSLAQNKDIVNLRKAVNDQLLGRAGEQIDAMKATVAAKVFNQELPDQEEIDDDLLADAEDYVTLEVDGDDDDYQLDLPLEDEEDQQEEETEEDSDEDV